jgi:FkbM family methyltransferase
MLMTDLGKWQRMRAEATVRRRAQVAYLGNGVVLARVLGSLKMFLRTDDTGFACHVMLDGYWEWWLTSFLARTVRAGMTVVDVGANFGYYTILFGELVGPAGHVVAVEPSPQALPLLRRTVELNGHTKRTRIVACALSSEAHGQGLLYLPDGEPKNACLVYERDIPGGVTVEVPVTSIDELSRDLPRIDLVKIDAEGGEVGVIAGMAELIARDRPSIVLEFNPSRYEEPGTFLEVMTSVYGPPRQIGFDGELHSIDLAAVIDRRDREDRLLYFQGSGAHRAE